MKKVLLGILLFFLSCINVFALEKELYNVSFQKDILGKKDWTSCNASSNYSCRATVMDKFWPSNNERIYYYKLISDGDKSKAKYYIYYNNVYPSSTTVQNSSDKRALKENEYFTFYVKNLNIKTSEYKDLRLNIDYAESTPGSGHSIIKNGGFEIYVIDQNNKTWGPYTVGDYTFNGIYKRDNYEEYYRGYNIISENLNKNKNITIKELKIVPYGNMPKKCSDGTWFCQRSFMFASVSINGYTDSNYKNPKVQLKKINVDSLRINTVRRMYDIATIKWTPTQSMKTVLSVKGFHYGTGSYEKDKFYYGPAYNQMNRVSVEKVYSVLDKNKKLPYVTDKDKNGTIVESANNFGADCAYAVFDAVSYYVPLTNLYSTVDALFDRTNITILGGLKADGKSADTSKVYTNLVNKYKNSSSTAFNQKVNQRLRSNDSRIWYLNTLGDDGYYYPQLGYTNMNSTTDKPAVSSSESLTLTLYNLNIAANKDTNVTIKYIIDERQTSNVYLDTSKLKIYGCSSDDVCNLFTDVKLNNNTKIIRTYDSGKRVILNSVTASIKNNRTITTIKILPYGTGSKKGEVFKFNRLELKVDNSSYLNVDAGNIVTYLSLYQYVGNLLDTTNTKLINKELTSAELNSFYSKYRAAQDMYKGYSELLVGDMISMNSGTRTHIRLITGSTHLVCLDGTTIELNRKTSVPTLSGNCDNHEGIDATRSYIIRSDISSSHPASSYNDRNNYGGFINSKDYVPSWTPNSKYTDIKKLTDLKDKNLDFYTNSKLTFETLLNTHYLPLRLNDYINDQI